ncbi:MAG: dNTP triphosphohydrolase, partial [Planctomycetes bacterium]|nr:dNTP triphosphohydrolase [Planctomycetota bacterium]
MNIREQIEKQETDLLAPFASKSRESKGRIISEKQHPYRTDFQRDRDRIIHSTAFRRLQAKTQVYIENEGDYFRTRLTHTMETAQIARTIARSLGINEDLSEALALAHDLGHPPFGHAGEHELSECMKDSGGFEHNWQGIRIVEKLEKKYDEFNGLNLSWEVRESMRKHTIKPGIKIEEEFNPKLQPLLECQATDLADYIAYNAHDVDDAIKAGLITSHDIEQLKIWGRIKKVFKEQRFSRTCVRYLIDILVSDLVNNTTLLLREHRIKTVDDVRNAKKKIICFSDVINEEIRELYRYL